MLLVILTVIVLFSWHTVYSANILFLEGNPSEHHHFWNKALYKFIAERGHNITVLSVFEERNERNLYYIQMEGVLEALERDWKPNHGITYTQSSGIALIKDFYDYHSFVSELLPKTEGFQKLLNYPDDFDFHSVIHDFTGEQVLLGFLDRFNNPPLSSVTAFGLPPFIYAVSGTTIFPSYFPHYATDFVENMTLVQRIKNTFYYIFDWIYREFCYLRKQNALVKQYFGDSYRSVKEYERNSTLVIVNTHPSLDYSIPVPPNVLHCAGLHTKQKEPLTPRQEILLNSAKTGSMIVDLEYDIPESKAEIFLEAFRQLPDITFIFKHSSQLQNVPSNVLIVEKIPRGSAIHHESVKAIISNGEKLTLHEAAWFHKPILGIPLHAEEFQNIAKVVHDGVGIRLNYENLSVNNLVAGINEIFEEKYWNASDHQSMKLGSNIAHPVEIANYFIEHVTFVGEALHLRSPIVDMPFWKLYMIDVIAVVFGLVIYVIYNIFQIFKKKEVPTQAEKKTTTVKKPSVKKTLVKKTPEVKESDKNSLSQKKSSEIKSVEQKQKAETKKLDKKSKKSN